MQSCSNFSTVSTYTFLFFSNVWISRGINILDISSYFDLVFHNLYLLSYKSQISSMDSGISLGESSISLNFSYSITFFLTSSTLTL